MDAFGAEEGDDGVQAVERSRVEGGVLGEGFAGVDAEDLQAEDLLFDLVGEVGGRWGVEWMGLEEALGLWVWRGIVWELGIWERK